MGLLVASAHRARWARAARGLPVGGTGAWCGRVGWNGVISSDILEAEARESGEPRRSSETAVLRWSRLSASRGLVRGPVAARSALNERMLLPVAMVVALLPGSERSKARWARRS